MPTRTGAEGRVLALRAGLTLPIKRYLTIGILGFAFAVGVGLAAAVATLDLGFAAGLALAVGAAASAVALSQLDGRGRAALALIQEHQAEEGAQWKREVGSKMPTSRAAIEQWVDKHPSTIQRAFLALALGWIDEAEVYLQRAKADTPEDRFDLELAVQTSALYRERPTDSKPLHALLADIGDPAMHRLKSQCLVLFEALQEVGRGSSSLSTLAAGWEGLGPPPPRWRPWNLVSRYALAVAVGPAVIVGLLGALYSSLAG